MRFFDSQNAKGFLFAQNDMGGRVEESHGKKAVFSLFFVFEKNFKKIKKFFKKVLTFRKICGIM